jgi:hypothetical protein
MMIGGVARRALGGSRRIFLGFGIQRDAVVSRQTATGRGKQLFFSATTKSSSSSSANSISGKTAPIWSNEFGFFYKKIPWLFSMTPTDLAGNISSILVLCAYSMSDMFELRVTAICATLLSVCFQYYRTVPLWIPIRWSSILLAINITMVTTLYLERRRANQMNPEMEQLYADGKFEKRGFSRVEFMRLYDLAETVTLAPGHVLVKQGQVKRSLHFVLDGKVRVSTKEGDTLATLDRYHFIGEMSLLSRMAQDFDSAASADVTVMGGGDGGTTFLKWDFETLEPYLRGDREVFNALSAYFNYDLVAKLLRDCQIQKASSASTVAAGQQEAVDSGSDKEGIEEVATPKSSSKTNKKAQTNSKGGEQADNSTPKK